MCGISGVYHFDNNRTVEQVRLKKMTDIIRHRGPDDDGFYFNGNIGMGHRRLSIIDLNTGDQPMYNQDKSISVILNGEIYNYVELREELIEKGHKFFTTSDTEVVIKSYEEWGVNCQSKFNGMWAFALWDNRNKQLFLSRDRIGEKPLHYSLWDNSLIFGSEIKSIIEYGVPKDYMIELLEIYLVFSSIPAPYTFFRNIKKLKPGHYIIANLNGMQEFSYWDLPEIDEQKMLKDKNRIYEEFENLLQNSVKLRMRSDVPVGAFLSGGLDSSAIVSLMAKEINEAVNTFTIGYKERDYDESSLAQEVAEKFNTNHSFGTVAPGNFENSLKEIVFHYDEPFGDSSAIATGLVSKLASKKVKVVLTGDGGDEALSGYTIYQGMKFASLYQQFPGFMRNSFSGLLQFLQPVTRGNLRYRINKIENVLFSSNLPFDKRILHKRSFTDFNQLKKLTNTIPNKINVEDYFADIVKNIPYKDDFYRVMYLNIKFDLPNDYLVKVDRMSMAYGLEVRVPFLDHRLIEYMVKVDKNVKMQGWERKSILKRTIGKNLPKSILNAPKKGFEVPLREWFKKDSFRAKLNELEELGNILDKKSLNRFILENQKGERDNGNFLWSLFVLKKVLD